MSVRKSSRLQNVGIVAAMIFGVWGAGLSSYQEYRLEKKEQPRIYVQLTVSRDPYKENAKSRPITFTARIQDSGESEITILPNVTFLVFNPGSGLTSKFDGKIAANSTYPLPQVLKAGDSISASTTVAGEDQLFAPNLQFAVVIQTANNEAYIASANSMKFTNTQAYDAMQEYIKYSAKVEFSSRLAVLLQH